MNNELTMVEKTLFVPLFGRIYVSKNFPKVFYDKKAVSLESLFLK